MSNLKYCYFSIAKIKDKYIGGLLIIDEFGMPLDFKYTDPISPSPLQAAIYGKSMENFIKNKIITKNLFKEVSSNNIICFTNIDNLNLLNNFVKMTIGVAPTMLSVDLKDGDYKQIKETEYLFKTKDSKNPLRMVFQDIPSSKILNGLEQCKQCGANFNILEPFSRINNAFKIICSE